MAPLPRHGETRSFYICCLPDGTYGQIPRWLCEPEAESMGEVVAEPRSSLESLEQLAELVAALVGRSHCQNPPHEQNTGGKDAIKTTGLCQGSGSSLGGSACKKEKETAGNCFLS